MKKMLILAVLLVLSIPQLGVAETILLKNGETLRGTIVEKRSYYIVIKVGNMRKKILSDEIESIEVEVDYGDHTMEINEGMIGDVPREKANLIILLLEINETAENISNNIEQTIANLPEDKKEEIRSLFVVEDIIERIVPVYAEIYTEEEIRGLLKFYSSPLGQKTLNVANDLVIGITKVNVAYIKEQLELRK